MWYYFLVAVIVLAGLAILVWSFAGKRKIERPGTTDAGTTEPVKRGQHLNT